MPVDFSLFDAVLLDLDGTIYFEEDVLPGAAELIGRLQSSGKKFACLSNSTSSPGRVGRRLESMNIRMDLRGVYTAGMAAVDYVLDRFGTSGRQARVFNLATEGVQEMIAGKVHCVADESEPCDAIIIGAPANVFAGFDRQRIALALLKKGATAVGVCADRIYPSPRGLEFGSGALTLMLGYAADVEPVYCGKPERIFFQELCSRIGVLPERCVLIGDNLESDIFGARRMGMKTVLTLTGVARKGDLENLPNDHRPDFIVNDLREV